MDNLKTVGKIKGNEIHALYILTNICSFKLHIFIAF